MRFRALSSVVLLLASVALGYPACSAGDEPVSAGARTDGGTPHDATTSTGGAMGTGGATGTGGVTGAGGTTAPAEAGTGGAEASSNADAGDGSTGSGGSIIDAAPDVPPDPRGTYSLACTGDAGSQVIVGRATELAIVGDWTIETWFKDEGPVGSSNFDHGSMYAMAKGDAQDSPYLMLTEWRTIEIGHIVSWKHEVASFDLNGAGYKQGTWIHAAGTYTAATKTVQIYVNGEPKTVVGGTLASSPVTETNSLVFCMLSGQSYWKGKLDDIRVWKVVRTATEIKDNYKTQLPKPVTGLVANWTFDEGAGTIAHDNTGNEYHGTLQGTASFSTDIHP
jgi:hypothetical protein